MSDTTIVKEEEAVIESPTPVEEVTETAPLPGEKTDPALLLKSLQEERRKRQELEDRVQALETSPEPDVYTDEGQALKQELDALKDKIALQDLTAKFPQLKDKAAEFEDFRTSPENKGMSIGTAAKAFLAENNLLVSTPPRKGLEGETGGGRVQPKVGRTEDEIADLRKNNFRQYMKEVRAGTLRA